MCGGANKSETRSRQKRSKRDLQGPGGRGSRRRPEKAETREEKLSQDEKRLQKWRIAEEKETKRQSEAAIEVEFLGGTSWSKATSRHSVWKARTAKFIACLAAVCGVTDRKLELIRWQMANVSE